jgi:hypothetical protein
MLPSLDRVMIRILILITRDGETILIQANGNFAPQFNGLHNQAYPQSNNQFFHLPSNLHPPH